MFGKNWRDKLLGMSKEKGCEEGSESVEKKKNSKELADQARRSGAKVADELEALIYEDHSRRIPAETIEKYRVIAGGLASQLKRAETLGIDTSIIDENLEKLVILLQKAIEKGYETYISGIFRAMQEIVQKERTNVIGQESEREWEMGQRSLRVSRRTVIMDYKFKIEELNDSIRNLTEDIAHGKQRNIEVTEELRKMNAEYPELAGKIKTIALTSPGETIDPKVLELDARRKRVIRIRNGIKQSEQICQMKEMRKEDLAKSISTLEHQLLAAGNMLQPELVEMQKEFQEQFEDALLQEKQDNRELEKANEEFDASLDQFFSDPDLINRIIKTDIAFNEMIKQEQKDAEARVQAQQRRQEEQPHLASLQINAN